MQIENHEPGTFCWVELGTTDAGAARAFYAPLFGWTFEDLPGPAGTYTILKKDGKDVGGLYELRPEQPPYPSWASYVRVERTDDAVAHAKELGGTVLMGPYDAGENGRMAVLQDPTGAVFSVWEPRAKTGAHVVDEPGTFCWQELYTSDPRRAADFYTQLFAWKMNDRHRDFGDYVSFEIFGRMFAGMLKPLPEWGPVPPHWLAYFAVEDCDAAVEQAERLGATVTVAPMEIEDAGRFALLADPQRAAFAVIRPK